MEFSANVKRSLKIDDEVSLLNTLQNALEKYGSREAAKFPGGLRGAPAVTPDYWEWYDYMVGGMSQEEAREHINNLINDKQRDRKANQSSSNSSSTSYNDDMAKAVDAYRAIVLPNGQEVNYDYADAAIRAAADAGTYQIKTYEATGGGKSLPSNNTSSASSSNVPALGTPEYTNYLIQQGAQLGLDLSQYSVPTTASGVSNTSEITMPSTLPSLGSITNATAGTAGIAEYLSEQMKVLEQERNAILSQQQKNQSWLQDFLSDQNSIQEERALAERELGMESAEFFADQRARISEIESLTQNYNSVKSSMEQQIAQVMGTRGTVDFLNRQENQIRRNAAPELNRLSADINAKAATLQALQGNFDRAQDYINQAVQDAVADRREKLEMFSMFYEMNQDTLNRLDAQYKDAMDRAYDLVKEQYANDLKMKTTLAELQLQNPQVAININGTLEAAMAAIQANPMSPSRRYQEAQIANIYADNDRLGGGNDEEEEMSVDQYARSYALGDIEITSVPEKYRAQVLKRANEIAEEAIAQAQTVSPAVSSPGRRPGASPEVVQKTRGLVNTVSGFFSNLFGD